MIITVPLLVLLGLATALLVVFSKREDKTETNWLARNPNPISNLVFPKIEKNQWIVYSQDPKIELRIKENMEEAEDIASKLGFEESRVFVVDSDHRALFYYRYGRKQKIPNQSVHTTRASARV